MRARGCLISFGVLALLGLVCCVLLWFAGLPWYQDQIEEEIRDGLATEIAQQFGGASVRLGAGTHTIEMTELERQLRDATGAQADDVSLTAADGRLELSFGSSGQSIDYTGVPVAQDGRLELTEVESTGGGFVDRIFPPGIFTGAVEGGVNSYFESQGLEIVSVTAENDRLTIETVEAGR
jgi:hypothetical protein